jgi:hypothetical protein
MDSGRFPSQKQQLTVCLGQKAAILTKPCNSYNEVQINHSSLPKETNLVRTFCSAFYVKSYEIKAMPTFLRIHNSDLFIFMDRNMTFELSVWKSNFVQFCITALCEAPYATNTVQRGTGYRVPGYLYLQLTKLQKIGNCGF